MISVSEDREALQRLYNEVSGCWSAFQYEIREAISNTNYAVVQHKLDAAKAILDFPARPLDPAQPPNETYRETVRRVAAAREKGYAAARANLQEAWSALAMIRETIETLAPSGSVKAAEHLDGPTFMHEAEALVAGILALSSVSSTHCACDTDHPLFKERGHHPHCPVSSTDRGSK